jgi:hypothetical protein
MTRDGGRPQLCFFSKEHGNTPNLFPYCWLLEIGLRKYVFSKGAGHMKDYPKHNMFVQEGPDQLLVLDDDIVGDLMTIVSPFDHRRTEEHNVAAVRDTYLHVPGDQTSSCLVYGEAEGKGFGFVIFRPSRRANSVQLTEAYCQGIAAVCDQPGIITWNYKVGAYFVAVDGKKTELPPWNKTLERLEEWFQHIKPGFKVQGKWNREMSYIQMRHAQLKGRIR